MGKNHRHQKKLKSEKSKTHIKSKTKFLPKGLNVTNTAFKIKLIVLQEQLKEKDPNQLLSKRKQTVPELITQLKHYSEKIKIEACTELCDLIKKHSVEVVQNYLALIVQNSCLLIQARESRVRKAAVKLITSLLQSTAPEKINPFFNYISTNLRCAMTNIDKNIQEDSLLIIDSLLELVPGLVARNSDKLFPDFLTLISKLRSDSGLDRTLTLNLGSKLTSVKWRIKVLSRLHGMLESIIQEHKKPENESLPASINFNVSGHIMPLYTTSTPFERCDVDFFGGSQNVPDRNGLSVHIAGLVPLLYETWLEVVPEKTVKKHAGGNTVLDEESAAILSCIAHILHLLHEYSKMASVGEIFVCKETEKFLDHLLLSFPYTHNRRVGKSEIKNFSKLFDSKDDPKCVEENLLIVHLFFKLKINLTGRQVRDKLNLVSDYLNRCLSLKNSTNSKNTEILTLILKEILLESPKFWQKFGLHLTEILENTVNFYDSGKVPANFETDFLDILTNFDATASSRTHQEWLGRLPSLLCQANVSAKLIKVVLELCKQNHRLVQEGVEKYCSQILENLKIIEIYGTENETEARQMLVWIFFYLPAVNFGEICQFIKDNPGLEYSKNFENMLDVKKSLSCNKSSF